MVELVILLLSLDELLINELLFSGCDLQPSDWSLMDRFENWAWKSIHQSLSVNPMESWKAFSPPKKLWWIPWNGFSIPSVDIEDSGIDSQSIELLWRSSSSSNCEELLASSHYVILASKVLSRRWRNHASLLFKDALECLCSTENSSVTKSGMPMSQPIVLVDHLEIGRLRV